MARNFNVSASSLAFATGTATDNIFNNTGTVSYFAKSNGLTPAFRGEIFGRGIDITKGYEMRFEAGTPDHMTFLIRSVPSNGGWDIDDFIIDNTNYNNFNLKYDTSNLGTDPIAKENNTLVTVNQVLNPSGTVTEAEFLGLGKVGLGSSDFGFIAEFAVWNSALTTEGDTRVSNGVSPFVVERSNLRVYTPMYGNGNTEIDYGPSRVTITIANIPPETTHPNVQLIETYL